MTDDGWIFERLAPNDLWSPNWPDVLERAGVVRVRRRAKLVLTLAAAALVAIPFVALAASNDWWFFRFGGTPTPASAPVVVKEGEWQGHNWQLVAYPSTTDGLCFGIARPEGGGTGGDALGCAAFVGVKRTPESKRSADMSITYLASGGSPTFPAYIVGPVIGTATVVEVRLGDGSSLQTETFAAPPSLAGIRFYAMQLPGQNQTRPDWVAGYDANGRIVACLAPLTAKDGISPLSDCR